MSRWAYVWISAFRERRGNWVVRRLGARRVGVRWPSDTLVYDNDNGATQ